MKQSAIRQDLLTAAVDRLPDNGLRAIRADALARFAKTGLPGTSHEDWKYTSLQPVVELGNAWLEAQTESASARDAWAPDFARQASEGAVAAHWLRFLDGRRVNRSLPDPASIQIGSLEPDVGRLITDDGLSSLNAALLHDALRLTVPDGVTVDRPIGLLLASDASQAGGVAATRIVIEVGHDARLEVIENHVSLSTARSFASVVVEVRLARGARVNYLRLQECDDAQILTGRLHVSIGQDASFHYTSIDLGGELVRNDVTIDLTARGSEVAANGLYLAAGSQHIDNHIRVEHRVGPTRSRAAFRGILHGNSRCVFNSKAIVHKGADGTDATQTNHNLLLSDKAEIDTKPELEIYADDVKCAHGATVGQLDESALFYLQSRGIDKDDAAQMLTRAFAAIVLGQLSVAAATDYVTGRIDRGLDRVVSE